MKFSLLRLLVFTAVIAVWAGASTALYHSWLLDDFITPHLRAAASVMLVPFVAFVAGLCFNVADVATDKICSLLEKDN